MKLSKERCPDGLAKFTIEQDGNLIDLLEYKFQKDHSWLVCVEGAKVAQYDDFLGALTYGISIAIQLARIPN